MQSSVNRSGITLLEVMVALVVIAVTVVAARGIAEQISSAGRSAIRALDGRLLDTARGNELRRVGALAVAPGDSTMVFDGALNDALISTRCNDARGFEGECRCRLRVRRATGGAAVLERSCGALFVPDTLAMDSTGLRLLYLVDAVNGGRWIAEWRRTNSLPKAIGVIRYLHGDTLIVRIGERG